MLKEEHLSGDGALGVPDILSKNRAGYTDDGSSQDEMSQVSLSAPAKDKSKNAATEGLKYLSDSLK